MNVNLQSRSEFGPPQLISLQTGQAAQIGRAPKADFVFARDVQMSSLHFRLEATGNACRIRDLGSSNGTFVNGRAVTDAELHAGDVIRAGQTYFDVYFGDVNPRLVESTLMPNYQWLWSPGPLPDVSAASLNHGLNHGPPVQVRPAVERREKAPQPSGAPPRIAPRGNVEQLRLLIHTREGNKVLWLRPGQSMTVGGTLAAQFTVRNDAAMSPVHFTVECLPQEVRIRDLASKSGTLVNGKAVESASLHDGDVILSGATTFAVNVDYAPDAAQDLAAFEMCVACPCANGVTVYRSEEGGAATLDIALRLAEELPLYLVVDYRKLGLRPPKGATYLMDWLPRALVAEHSPVVVSRRDVGDFDTLFANVWSLDAAVCLYSELNRAELLGRLRIAARGQHRASAVANPRHMLGAMHPSELKSVIPQADAAYTEFLFSGVAAMLLEGSTPKRWELLTGGECERVLNSAGLQVHTED